MIKYECDRCGRLTNATKDSFDYYSWNNQNDPAMLPIWLGHLCDKCIEELKSFLALAR